MGNARTIDPYCGKDPNLTQIHFTQDPVRIKIQNQLKLKTFNSKKQINLN